MSAKEETRLEIFLRLQAEGLSYSQIGERCGVTRNVVAAEIFRHKRAADIEACRLARKAITTKWRLDQIARHVALAAPVTPLEQEIVRLYGEGLTQRAIGSRLGFSSIWVGTLLRRCVYRGSRVSPGKLPAGLTRVAA